MGCTEERDVLPTRSWWGGAGTENKAEQPGHQAQVGVQLLLQRTGTGQAELWGGVRD